MPCIKYHSYPTIALSVGKINTQRSMTFKRMMNETISVGTKKVCEAFNFTSWFVYEGGGFLICPPPIFKIN